MGNNLNKRLLVLLFYAIVIIPVVGAAESSITSFIAAPTTGPAPLTVTFTDQLTGSPTGWAWFFGDENFTAPWTQQTASAGWSQRYMHSGVAMPDGSIVLMGGITGGSLYNDVWRSTDNGATWTQQTASAGWSARNAQSSVAMPDGSIVLMGGYGGGHNDVWRSTDNGAHWTEITHPIVFSDYWGWQIGGGAEWSARGGHSSVAMPDGSIVLMGGYGGSYKNDVWQFMPAGSSAQNPAHTYTIPGVYTVQMVSHNSTTSNPISKITITVLPQRPLSVTAISPSAGINSLNISTTVAGTGFKPGVVVKLTLMGQPDIVASYVTLTGDSSITCALNLTEKVAEQWNVVVTNPDGTSATLQSGFTITGVVPPTLQPLSVTAISPSAGINSLNISATVTGTGFRPGAAVKLTLTGQPDIVASGVTLTGDSTIACTFDLNGKTTGTWDLAVTNPSDGTTSVRSTAFTLTAAPIITNTNGTIIVSSTPQDALVYLDGSVEGTGSVTLQEVSPGYHSVRVTKTMYNDYVTDVRVAAGSTNYVNAVLTPVSGTSGTIIASSNPAGANVYLDGMDKGISPVTITGVSSGSHTVSFTKTGYTATSRMITMTAGQTMDITVDLTKTGGDWGDLLNTTTLIIVGIVVLIIVIIGFLLRKKKNRWDNY